MTGSLQGFSKRGFVMTGGGAKGLYEAGVVHAFHLCGMEFDVITGSSIGAMNAIFFAEYLFRKRHLPSEIRKDPERALEEMDNLIKAYHHAWLRLPDIKIIDDSEEGPLGRLKNDLLQFDIDLPSITRLVWWWSDPNRWHLPYSPKVWLSITKLVKELLERLGGGRELLRIWGESRKKDKRPPFYEVTLRAYLARFGLERALVPPGDDSTPGDRKLKALFTEPISPLRPEHLQAKVVPDSGNLADEESLVDPKSTLRDYAEAGIDVRLTRANYRTGRLEISAFLSARDFVAYLEKHAWRWQRKAQQAVALGSSRLQVLGNPNAVNAALASGRFPGVFVPFPVKSIYDLENASDLSQEPENRLLNHMLEDWLENDEVKAALFEAFKDLHGDKDETELRSSWERRYNSWQGSKSLRSLFPKANDTYVDGGAIDNTPSNSAIDAIREWADRENKSLRDVTLDLYVVFLHPAPDPGEEKQEQDPASYQVVGRTLKIQGAAKLASDAVVVRTINTFGKRGEELGKTSLLLSGGMREVFANLEKDLPEGMTQEQKRAVEKAIKARLKNWFEVEARKQGLGYTSGSVDDILERIDRNSTKILQRQLPLNVEPIEIYPDEMPMETLQFTERLGYDPNNAVVMLTVGCYNTLWTLRTHLEKKAKKAGLRLDDVDDRALSLARKWMGFEEWPEPKGQEHLRERWQCRREKCVFYADHCKHGKRAQKVEAEAVN